MISAIDHFTSPTYNEAWATRPAEIGAYIMYANAKLDARMRRRFPGLYKQYSSYTYAPLLVELANAGVIISAEPWRYTCERIPRFVTGPGSVTALLNRDYRYNCLIPLDVDEVASMCSVIAGATVRSGYRAHPYTFAQLTQWDYDEPHVDERMCAMKWAEEDWREELLADVKNRYYELMKKLL